MRLCPQVSFVALLGLLSIFTSARAYDIDENSCTGDLLDYIKRSVAEAHLMAQAGNHTLLTKINTKGRLIGPDGDSIKEMWHTTKRPQLRKVQGYLHQLLKYPLLFKYKPGSAPLFFCNGNTFVKQSDGSFRDSTSGITIKPKEDLDSMDEGAQATTYQSSRRKLPENPGNVHSVIVIRPQTLPGAVGASPDSAGAVATLSDIINQRAPPVNPNSDPNEDAEPGQPGLYQLKPINRIVGYWLTSAVILHEYMHVAFPDMISHGTAEVYGWNLCAGRESKLKPKPLKPGQPVPKPKDPVPNYVKAIANADNYMNWCLSAYVEAKTEYKVLKGRLFIPPSSPGNTPRAQTPRNPFQYEAW